MRWPTGRMTVSEEAAREAGLVAITSAYLPEEEGMARAALESLRLGGVQAVLVRVAGGVEVWRERTGMRES